MSVLKQHRLALAALAIIAAFYAWWGNSPFTGQLGSDGPSYLMMAHHYAHKDDADPVYVDNAVYSRFPPLYPLVLAWTHAADDLRLAHAVTSACLVAALGVLYAWYCAAGLRRLEAAALMLLCACLPGSWLAALTIQTEYLYLLLSMLALLLLYRYAGDKTELTLYAAAMTIALATLTRTIGVSLYLPLLVVLLRAPWRRAVLAGLISVLPVLLWHLLHRSHVGYVDALSLLYSGDKLGALKSQLEKELPALHVGFAGNFTLFMELRPALDVLGAACLAAMGYRAARLKPEALYCLANLFILLLWPYPEEAQRFLWVLVPLLLAQPVLAVREYRRTAAPQARRLVAALMPVAVAATILPSLALAGSRYRAATATDLPDARFYTLWYNADFEHAWDVVTLQTGMINMLNELPSVVPSDDCVMSTRPDLVNYYGRRRSYFPPLNSTPEPYFSRQLRYYGCHYVFVMSSIDGRYPVSLYPMERLGRNPNVQLYNMIPTSRQGQVMISSMVVKID